MKNQKGITLVALVVTIIVLLILAGVTIMFVLQGDSIFGQANKAKTETHTANVKDSLTVAFWGVQAKYYDPADNTDFFTTGPDGVRKLKENPETTATTKLVAELTKAGISVPTADGFKFTKFNPGTEVVGNGNVYYQGVKYTVTINVTADDTTFKVEAQS